MASRQLSHGDQDHRQSQAEEWSINARNTIDDHEGGRGSRSYRPGRRPAPAGGLALLVIAIAQLMVVLDATIVNVALPHIQRARGFSGSGRNAQAKPSERPRNPGDRSASPTIASPLLSSGSTWLLLTNSHSGLSLVARQPRPSCGGVPALAYAARSCRAGTTHRPRLPRAPAAPVLRRRRWPRRALPAQSLGRLHVIRRLGEEQLRVICAGQVSAGLSSS